MNGIAARKCVRHTAREAVASCPACSGHFCRECVVEHAGRLLCAACLAKEAVTSGPAKKSWWPRVSAGVLTVAAGVFLWVGFYALGQFLKAIPAEVHEGTVWAGGD